MHTEIWRRQKKKKKMKDQVIEKDHTDQTGKPHVVTQSVTQKPCNDTLIIAEFQPKHN